MDPWRTEQVPAPPLWDENAKLRQGQWEGTLIATWRDSGLTESGDDRVRNLKWLLLLVLAFAAWMTIEAGPGRGALILVLYGGLAVGWSLWARRGLPPASLVTLTLDTDRLRIHREVEGQGASVVDLPRAEAGTLVRRGDSASVYVGQLSLEDASGKEVAVLIDRLVEIKSVPFGDDLLRSGLEGGRVPLSVLIGTWWPKSVARRSERLHSRSPFRDEWNVPDLPDYPKWIARREVGWAAILLAAYAAIGAFFLWQWADGNPTLDAPTILVMITVLLAVGLYCGGRAWRHRWYIAAVLRGRGV
jgi:hypothetical protein